MGAVHVGVGHDDDPFVAQVVFDELIADAGPQGFDQITQFLVGLYLVGRGAGDVQDLAAKRQHRLGLAVAARFRRAAGGIALDQKDFRAFGGGMGAIGQFPRQAQLLGCRLALHFLVVAALEAHFGPFDDVFEDRLGHVRGAGQPEVEVITQGRLDELLRLRRGQAFLGLTLELWVGDEQRQHDAGVADDVVGGDFRRLLVVGEFPIGAQPLGQRAAKAQFVGAALGRRHGIAVRIEEPVFVERPGDGPFHLARGAASLAVAVQPGAAGERFRRQRLAALQFGDQEILESAGKMQGRLGGRCVVGPDQLRIARPADFDAPEQIGLGPRHPVQQRRAEMGAGVEDLGVGVEDDGCAAAVLHGATFFQPGFGDAANEGLRPQFLVPGDLDRQAVRQRIDHR